MEEEYDIQSITCKKCGHIKLSTANVIQSIANDSYQCEVCFNEDGVLHNQNTTRCAECNQVWRSNQAFYHIRGCKASKEPGLKIKIDPFNQWRKENKKSIEQNKIDTEIDFQKSQRILKDRVAKERQIPLDRQVRIEQLLTTSSVNVSITLICNDGLKLICNVAASTASSTDQCELLFLQIVILSRICKVYCCGKENIGTDSE